MNDMFDRQFWLRAAVSTTAGAALGLALSLLLAGCGHAFNLERARQLGCNEACARAAGERGLNAMLKHNRVAHFVIVDGVADGRVRVRDPWGVDGLASARGLEGEIEVEPFLEYWRNAQHRLIIRSAHD